MNGTLSEQELMKRIAAGDQDALKKLYDRYERLVYAFAYRMVKDAVTAEEIVQELFLRIWNKAERIDGVQGKPTGWIFTLTRNISVDLLRRKRSRSPHSLAATDQLQRGGDESLEMPVDVEQQWIGDQLKEALDDLSKDQKQVVELIYYQGYTHQEVSERYGIPQGTVKSRVRLALKQLQHRLSGIGRREHGHEREL